MTSSMRNAFEQPETSGCDVDGALRVVERIGLVGTTRSELSRQFRGILAVSEFLQRPTPNRSPNVLCFPGCSESGECAQREHDIQVSYGQPKVVRLMQLNRRDTRAVTR